MAGYTKNFNLKLPSDIEFYDIEDFNENFEKIDQMAVKKGEGIGELTGGALSDRPEPGVAGRYYFAQDTGEIFLDTGEEWVLAAASQKELAAHKADYVSFKENTDNFKSDYEYQTPIIVGRQIRLQKKSDTNILKFRLNEDMPEGTQITISLDNGATSKPLKGFEGEPITELEKGFVEVIADANFFTLHSKGKLNPVETFGGESESWGGYIDSISVDDDYVYACERSTRKVFKIRKRDMVTTAESMPFGEQVGVVMVEGDYVYVGEKGNNGRISKLRKSDMVKVGELDSLGDIFTNVIVADNTYLYSGGYASKKIHKIDKSNMTLVSQSAIIDESTGTGAAFYALGIDEDYIYVSGYNRNEIWKVRKADMAKTIKSANYGSQVRSIIVDDSYVYVAGDLGSVWKITKNDMVKISESEKFPFAIHCVLNDNEGMYVSGSSIGIYKIIKSSMQTKVGVSIKNISEVLHDKDFIYAKHLYKVLKFNKYIYELLSQD